MALDTTTFATLMDNAWEDITQETAEFTSAFWNRVGSFAEADSNLAGRKVKVRTGYNESESWAAFTSASGFAQGANSSFTTFTVPYRTVSEQVLLDKEVIDNDGAYAKYHPVAEELAMAVTTGFKKLNRACLMGDGTAAIGVLTANYAGGTPTLVVTGPSATVFGDKGSQFIPAGKKVQVYDSTGATLRNGTIGGEGILTVSSNVLSTGTLTMTSNAPSDGVIGDIVVPERSAGRGIHGLPYWVSNTGSIFTASRTTYPGLKSVVVNGSTGSLVLLVESLFSQLAHYVGEDVALGINGEGMHEFFWSPTQREAYRKAALGLGITMLGSDKLDVGYAHREQLNGYTFTTIKDMDNTKVYALKLGDFKRVTLGTGNNPFKPEPIHGNQFYNLADSQGRISGGMGFVMSGYVNLACTNVRNQAVINTLPVSGLADGNV